MWFHVSFIFYSWFFLYLLSLICRSNPSCDIVLFCWVQGCETRPYKLIHYSDHFELVKIFNAWSNYGHSVPSTGLLHNIASICMDEYKLRSHLRKIFCVLTFCSITSVDFCKLFWFLSSYRAQLHNRFRDTHTVRPPTYNVRPKIARLLQSLGYLPIEWWWRRAGKEQYKEVSGVSLAFPRESLSDSGSGNSFKHSDQTQIDFEHRWSPQSLHLIWCVWTMWILWFFSGKATWTQLSQQEGTPRLSPIPGQPWINPQGFNILNPLWSRGGP